MNIWLEIELLNLIYHLNAKTLAPEEKKQKTSMATPVAAIVFLKLIFHYIQ